MPQETEKPGAVEAARALLAGARPSDCEGAP